MELGLILVFAVATFLVYAMAIEPRRVDGIIGTRLAVGDSLPSKFNVQEIAALLQAADWIRDKKEVKLGEPDADGTIRLIEVICKGVTYQIQVSDIEGTASKLTVSATFKSGSWDIERVRRLQEANRIRCRIMERVVPGFTEQPQDYYGVIKTMYLLRYCAIAVIAAFLCCAVIPEILNRILGEDSVSELHILGLGVVVLLFVGFGVALSSYIMVTRSEKLLNGVPVPQHLNNEELMELLRGKLHIETLQSLYFDETKSVTIKGKYGTYLIGISSECPRLSVVIQGSGDAKAYQEADYIQCSIAKLFHSAHPEKPEKMYTMLMTIRRGNLMQGISLLAFIALLAAPFLLNYFGSKGIANSYLTQYSETVTIGEAFEAFFADPKWKNYKVGGQEYVDFTGKCTYYDEEAVMRITFAHFGDTFNVNNIAINGVDMSALLWHGLLSAIYSEAENTSVAASALNSAGVATDVSGSEVSYAVIPEPDQTQPLKDENLPTQAPASGTEQFPSLPPADPNDPNADILSAPLGMYVNENGCYLSLGVASSNGLYYGGIFRNQLDAQNGENPLVEFAMGGRDYLGTFIFVDSAENLLYFAQDSTITDGYALFLYGDSYFDDVDMSPYFDTTFYMVEEYIDVTA